MRIATRVVAGVGTAAVLIAGAPVATANAATTSSTPVSWGPYTSSDGKAKAEGAVSVEKLTKKVGYWKKWATWTWKCRHKDGKKVCVKVKTWHKKWAWKKVSYDRFTVTSTLSKSSSHKKWPSKFRCAWESFKVVKKNGDKTYRTFSNCDRTPAKFVFTVRNADKIWVDVSRGNKHAPKGAHSGWKVVHPAA